MSLMKTLAKVAIGVAAAKGMKSVMNARQSGTQTSGGGVFGGTHSPTTGASSGGLSDMLGSVLGSSKAGGNSSIGGLLEQLGGSGTSAKGGLSDVLGSLTGGSGGLGGLLTGAAGGAASGGLGDMLGSLTKGPSTPEAQPADTSFGDLFNQALVKEDEPEVAPTQAQEVAAGLMLTAMIQAAKADGKVDEAEQAKLLGKLGDVSAEERAFVQAQMAAPVDVAGLAAQVPAGLEQQLYLMSVLGIDLDNREEAQYLHDLASAMGLGQQQVNDIHDHLGVPKIYG